MMIKRFVTLFTLATTLTLALPASAQAAPVTIKLWRHETGDSEVNANLDAIKRFNASQTSWNVVYETLPQGTYTESITAAAKAGQLPCVFDMDEPTVPNFAWSGNIQPLDQFLSKDLLADIIPGALGTYQGKIYSIGQFDVSLAIFARKSILNQYNIRIPTTDKPWTLDEFNAALKTLKDSGKFAYPLDMHTGGNGEWYPYAYAPLLQSFGGDLINRKTFLTADDSLNGPQAVAWGKWFAGLFSQKYADPKDADGMAFIQGRSAIEYNGSWAVGDNTKAWGDDLLSLPPPDLGNGPKVGSGSWHWGISQTCDHADGAAAFINFIMQPAEVAAISNVTSLIPTTGKAAALTDNYKQGGKWGIFYTYAKMYATARPPTPAYPFLSSTFDKASHSIVDGANVQDTLDNSVDAINRNISDNKGYGFSK